MGFFFLTLELIKENIDCLKIILQNYMLLKDNYLAENFQKIRIVVLFFSEFLESN
jgi:hypothetical protein